MARAVPDPLDPKLDARARYALDKALRSGQGNWDHIEALLREIVTAHNNTVTFINQQLDIISDIINSGGQTSASDTDVDTTDFDTIPPTADDTQTVIEYIDQTLTQLIEQRGDPNMPLALDGDDSYMWPQGGGGAGTAGATGATGPAGPATPGFPGTDGEDAYDWAIPGTKGDPGGAGATGSTGPTGVGAPGSDGDDAYDWAMPGTKGDPGRDGVSLQGAPGIDGEDMPDWPNPGTPGPPGPASIGPQGPPGVDADDVYDWAMPGTKGDPGRDGGTGVGAPGFDGEDAYDWAIPGQAGAAGTAGAAGPAGPATPGIPGDEGEAAYDWAMPGTKGDPGRDGGAAAPIPGADGEDGYNFPNPGAPGAAGAQGAPGSSGTGGGGMPFYEVPDDPAEYPWMRADGHQHAPAPDVGFFDVGQTGTNLIPGTEQFLDQFSVLKVPGSEVVTIPGTSVLLIADKGNRGSSDDVTKRFLGARVKNNTGSVTTGAGTWTFFNWSAVEVRNWAYFFDPLGMFSNTSSTTGFTIPKTGWWRLSAQVTLSNDVTASRRGMAIGINGTAAPGTADPQSLWHNGSSNTQQAGNCSGLYWLKAGDTANLSGFSDVAVNMSNAQLSAEFVGV